jgi:hypothetical protein
MPSLYLRFLCLLLGIPIAGSAQEGSKEPRQYVILSDSLGPLHRIKVQRGGRQFEGIVASGVERGASTTTTIPKTSVEIFNLLISGTRVKLLSSSKQDKSAVHFLNTDTLLITMALLPRINSEVTWLPVQLDTIPSGRLATLVDVVQDGGQRIAAYRQAGNPGDHRLLCRDNVVPLVKHKGQYWAPNSYVLTEYFQVRHRPTQNFPETDLATINILSRPFPKEVLLQTKRRQTGNAHAQLTAIPAGNVIQRRNEGRYEFWSNPSTVLSHPSVLHYGSGDFQYQPGTGVVSSTYKHYFQSFPDPYLQYVWDEPFEVISIDGQMLR